MKPPIIQLPLPYRPGGLARHRKTWPLGYGEKCTSPGHPQCAIHCHACGGAQDEGSEPYCGSCRRAAARLGLTMAELCDMNTGSHVSAIRALRRLNRLQTPPVDWQADSGYTEFAAEPPAADLTGLAKHQYGKKKPRTLT